MPCSGGSANRARRVAMKRLSRRFDLSASCRPQHEGHSARESFPLRPRFAKRFPSGGGQFVETGAAIVLRSPPRGADEPLPHEPVEGRIERALVDAEQVL